LAGFDTLYHRLDKHPNAFELDESQYDSSLFARAMYGQMELRWECLSEAERMGDRGKLNRRRLERLYEDIVHSVIVLENGELIQKHTGNPSGSGNTIVDNTCILFRLFAYAFIVLNKEVNGEENKRLVLQANTPSILDRVYGLPRFGSYKDFMDHVEAALNGDDNTYTCSDEIVGWFNPINIGRVWTGIGVTTKTPCETPRKLSECTFLSQGWTLYTERGSPLWLPRPETDRILSSLMWGSNVDDVRWHLLRACALRIDSWGNEECRIILKSYIEWLWLNHADSMVGSVNDIDMSSIMAVRKSDDWIYGLYSGFEGLVDLRVESFKFPFIHCHTDISFLSQVENSF
jgi:hypothetical protein